MTDTKVQDIAIGSDAALVDPAQDAFGYAPFAQRIADAVRKTHSPQGLVMAIHGLWGSGKSTLLNFVRYDLSQPPSKGQPIVIDFNPWWFNSREHLAAQFLSQFRSKLPHESEVLRTIGDKMADYGSAIGTVIAGTYGIPCVDKLIAFILGFLKRKPKDVPTIKAEIAKALDQAGQRFVFVIDDIDRLAPDEIRELFKVIKALADFPNVIYLLAFDRKVVSDALHTSLGVEGEAYLEKIIQVQFSLPTVDRARLRKKLFVELDRILESFPLRTFDQTYWGNVYFYGLDHYVSKPRDIVRIINTLCVTYPAVAGEVNAIDFIALEFLRVFEPEVYGVIRDHRDMFVGHSDRSYGQNKELDKAFHENWLDKVSANRRSAVKTLLSHLFPKVESILGNMSYGADWTAPWRKELRVCSSDIFDVYFQFGVAPDALRRTELDELIAIAVDPEKTMQILKAAAAIKRPDGTSKASEYLERLYDFTDEITPDIASGLSIALFSIGDVLLSPEDEQGGMTAIPNRWRLSFAVDHLLKRIPAADQKALLNQVISQGEALCLVVDIVSRIENYRSKPEESYDSPLAQIDEHHLNELKSIVTERLCHVDEHQFLALPDFSLVIHFWIKWSDQEAVASRLNPILASDVHLPVILEKYLRFATTQGMGDAVGRRIPRLNPKDLEPLTDISVLEIRIEQMLRRNNLTAIQRTAGEQFLKGMERIRQGKAPDDFR